MPSQSYELLNNFINFVQKNDHARLEDIQELLKVLPNRCRLIYEKTDTVEMYLKNGGEDFRTTIESTIRDRHRFDESYNEK